MIFFANLMFKKPPIIWFPLFSHEMFRDALLICRCSLLNKSSMCKNRFLFGLFWNSNAQKGSQGWTWSTLFELRRVDAIGAANALLEGATKKASKTFI